MLLTPLYTILYVVIISFLPQNGLWDEFLSFKINKLLWGEYTPPHKSNTLIYKALQYQYKKG